LSKERILNTPPHNSQVGSNTNHTVNININISGMLQLQDSNGTVHDWNNPQFVSELTQKVSMEITKQISHVSRSDGRLLYGGFSRGMFG
jgi:hypothetical protein